MAFLAFSPLREYPQVKSEKVRWSWKNDPDKGMWTVLMSCGIRYYPYIASGLESLHLKQYASFLIHQQDDLWNWKLIDCPGWKKERCQGHTLWPASTVDLASWWEQNRIMILPRHPTASPHGIHRQPIEHWQKFACIYGMILPSYIGSMSAATIQKLMNQPAFHRMSCQFFLLPLFNWNGQGRKAYQFCLFYCVLIIGIWGHPLPMPPRPPRNKGSKKGPY